MTARQRDQLGLPGFGAESDLSREQELDALRQQVGAMARTLAELKAALENRSDKTPE
jgi:hypothetical protein